MQNDGGGSGNGHQHAAAGPGTDPKVYVATTLAALVLAGSAYIWKSGSIPMLRTSGGIMNAEIFRRGSIGDQDAGTPMPADAGPFSSGSSSHTNNKGPLDAGDSRASATPAVGQTSPKKRRGSQAKQQDRDHDGGGEAGDASAGSLGRASRPKERRRRGKDPTKELVKSGKLNSSKAFSTTTPARAKAEGTSPSPSGGQTSTTPRPHRRASRSPSQTLSDTPLPASLQRSTSRPQSGRERGTSSSSVHEDADPVFTFDSFTTNRDIASTSSASSTAATEGTTASSTSTAPSSTTGGALASSDETPKAELASTNRTPSSSSSSSNRHSGAAKDDPWDWDRDGQFSSLPRSHPVPQSSDLPRFQQQGSKAHHVDDDSRKSQTSSEVQSLIGVPPIPLASTVAPADGKPLVDAGASSSSATSAVPSSSSSSPAKRLGAQGASTSSESREEHEREEVSFPTLNNPSPSAGPASSSSLISPHPITGTGRNSVSPSISRPQSRASSSSATSSSNKGKSKNSRAISGLTSLSTRNSSSMANQQRRAPAPLDASSMGEGGRSSGGRPATPSSSSLASTHPPPSPSSPYHHHNTHSPSASTSGNSSSNVAVSAQTQLASLRGALEAARLREEKSRSELEKVTRDVDALRWENAASRRREGELKAQLQQVMLQMQGYATYITAMSQQAQAAAQGQPPPGFQLQLPPALHHPAISPPAPAEIVTIDSQEDLTEPLTEETTEAGRVVADEDNKVDAEGIEAPTLSGEEAKPVEKPDDTEQPSWMPLQDAKDGPPLPSSPPTHPPLHPPTILPFAPQPLHGTFPGTGIPMPLQSPFLLHHPGTPNSQLQSPLFSSGPHSPFATFPSHQHPSQPPLPHPHFPFTGVGLSGGGPHMHPLQSPVHPGHPGMLMMSPHMGTGLNGLPSTSPFSAGPASPTTSNFRPMTPTHGAIPSNMGIGMANGGSHHPPAHVASPLWMMNGLTGTGSAGGTSSKLSMSPNSGPSSPLPPYLQSERGRKGWQRSRPSSVVGGLKGDLGDVDSEGIQQQGGHERGDVDDAQHDNDDDVDDGEVLNPVLADAILKRPSSIRMNSKRSTSNFAARSGASSSSAVGLSGSISMPGMANAGGTLASPSHSVGLDEPQQPPSPPKEQLQRVPQYDQEEVEEVMFPSLSDLGNVVREKRVGTPALGDRRTSNSRPRSALSSRPVLSSIQSNSEFGNGSEHIP